jgi:hypothetical protein
MSTLKLYTEYTGKEFNEITKGTQFYRFTNQEEDHNGFAYKDGLNIDFLKFNPNGQCSAGGLYFTDAINAVKWMGNNNWMRIVTIPYDARVYIENNKYKIDRFMLSKRKPIHEFTFDDYDISMAVVSQNGLALQYVKEQTPELCMAAVSQNSLALEYVKEQTPELCMAAVSQNGWALKYVKEQTPELCMVAVSQNSLAFQYMKEQTPDSS